jgi:hypothetical protein
MVSMSKYVARLTSLPFSSALMTSTVLEPLAGGLASGMRAVDCRKWPR